MTTFNPFNDNRFAAGSGYNPTATSPTNAVSSAGSYLPSPTSPVYNPNVNAGSAGFQPIQPTTDLSGIYSGQGNDYISDQDRLDVQSAVNSGAVPNYFANNTNAVGNNMIGDVPTTSSLPTPTQTTTIPMNLFPFSQSQNRSSSSSSSRSGINWDQEIAAGMLPHLLETGGNLPGVVDRMGQTLQDQYNNTMRRALQPDAFQGTLNQLANRGVLDSNIASDALASATKGISKNIADQGFNSQLAQQQAQMQVPSILANLAALAQETKSSGGSSSSGSSYQANPLAPYQLASGIVY